jgi:hypothetical protein
MDYLIINRYIIILTDAADTPNDRNIYCYFENGTFKWQIEASDKLHSRNYYTSIRESENGLIAYSKNGIEATIDLATGNILDKELIK